MVCCLVSLYFDKPQLGIQKNKLHITLGCWSRDRLNFEFLEKSLGIVSPAHFVHDFSREMFLMLYSFNCPDFIIWLSSLLDISRNMCIAILFEIKLIFLIKPFFCMTKKTRQKFKCLEIEKRFYGEMKKIYRHF